MIQKILAALLVAALLAAPVAGFQVGKYTKGSEEQLDYTIEAYENFKRIYNDDKLRSELKTFKINGSKLYLLDGQFVYDATLHWLCIPNSMFMINTDTGVMYDTRWKYDSRTNEVSEMSSEEFQWFGDVERPFVLNLHAMANELGWKHTVSVVNITKDW